MQQRDTGRLGFRRLRLDGAIADTGASLALLEGGRRFRIVFRQKHAVHRIDSRGLGAVVCCQGPHTATDASDFITHSAVRINIATPKTIDRLFWIAHDDDPMGLGALHKDRMKYFPLHRIGVLKLVNHSQLEFLAHGLNGAWIAFQHEA